jgi:hypothetical protein
MVCGIISLMFLVLHGLKLMLKIRSYITRERLGEAVSIIAIAIIALYVERRTGQGMLPLIMDAMPELLERK